MRHRNWSCAKCGHDEYDTGEIRVAGGFWSKIFDVQANKFSSVSCEQCGYTEFYKGSTSMLGNVFDFFTN